MPNQDELANFIDESMKYINQEYHEDPECHQLINNIREETKEYISSMGAHPSKKKLYYNKNEDYLNNPSLLKKKATLFVKKEVLIGNNSTPRPIIPVEDTLRNYMAVISKPFREQTESKEW